MRGKRDHSRRLIAFARQMRKEPTDAERKLWFLLRRGVIDGHYFRRQVPVEGYVLDFCCLAAGLAIEADGGQHGDPARRTYDRQRDAALAARGIRVLRFADHEILKYPQAVQETIERELRNRPPPQPSPATRSTE